MAVSLLLAEVIEHITTCPFASEGQGEVFFGTNLFKKGVLILVDKVS